MMTLSCSDKKNTADESEKGVSIVLPDTKNEVAVQILKKRDFHHELVSNGKINAVAKPICVLKPVKSSLILCEEWRPCTERTEAG